jgi:hypothetical protein
VIGIVGEAAAAQGVDGFENGWFSAHAEAVAAESAFLDASAKLLSAELEDPK